MGQSELLLHSWFVPPGPYYDKEIDKSGKDLFSTTVIPNRGAWLEYETDSNEIISVRVDRTRKQPVTTLLRALGIGSNQEIIDIFGEEPRLLKTLEKDTTTNYEEGLKEIYKKLRPGEPPTVDSAQSLFNSMFFDPKRYDLAKVGRYKYNKKLGLSNRLSGVVVNEDVIDPNTGEVLAEKGQRIDKELAMQIEDAGVEFVMAQSPIDETKVTKVIGSQFVALKNYIDFDISDLKIPDKVYYPVLMEILQENEDQASVKDALKLRKNELSPKHILVADVIASVSYLLNLNYGIGNTDDIDHLGNRRLRTVGELLQNQIRIGLSRMERTIKERMTTQDISEVTPAGTDEYSSGDCCSKRIFRKFSAVSVYGPEQPAGRTDPQEKTFRTGSWRYCPEKEPVSRFETYIIPTMEECARSRLRKVRTSV